MIIKKSFKLGSLLAVVGIAAATISAVVVPHYVETRISNRFGESGSVTESWLIIQRPTHFEHALGFKGFVETVVLNGNDKNIKEQVSVVDELVHVKSLRAFSLQTDLNLKLTKTLRSLREAEFSYCSGSFIRLIVSASPKLKQLVVWECADLTDSDLASINRCVELQSISIDGAAVSGTFVASHHPRANIAELTLAHTPVDNLGIESISGVKSLRELSLSSDTKELRLSPLAKLLSLRTLDLVGFEDRQADVELLRLKLRSTQVLWR